MHAGFHPEGGGGEASPPICSASPEILNTNQQTIIYRHYTLQSTTLKIAHASCLSIVSQWPIIYDGIQLI